MKNRTDLAAEAKKLWENSPERTTKLEGVIARERGPVTKVEILDSRGEKALGKPRGCYITMELDAETLNVRTCAEQLAEEIRGILHLKEQETVLVVGLGNRAVTPDAVGPRTVDRLLLTRHLVQGLPDRFGDCRQVSAVVPGVLATTGIESLETVRGVVEHVQPDKVIAVDALAAADVGRLCRTVQMSDAGIAPGSGGGKLKSGV